MRSKLIHYSCVSMTLFSALTLEQEARTAARTRDQDIQVIRMTAKKYEFSPSSVHVKAGTKVQLKITAIDRDHGFTTAIVPDCADSSARPGLEFTAPQGNDGWKLKKGIETTIEFFAKTPGTYAFRCSVACGIHHGRMKGQLVVDPRTNAKQCLMPNWRVNVRDFYIHANSIPPRPFLVREPRNEQSCLGPEEPPFTTRALGDVIAYRGRRYPPRKGRV